MRQRDPDLVDVLWGLLFLLYWVVPFLLLVIAVVMELLNASYADEVAMAAAVWLVSAWVARELP